MATVLIVEDQERVAKAIALLLDLHGIESLSVEGPKEALAALRSDSVDLVIQDMNFSPGATSGQAEHADGAGGDPAYRRQARPMKASSTPRLLLVGVPCMRWFCGLYPEGVEFISPG